MRWGEDTPPYHQIMNVSRTASRSIPLIILINALAAPWVLLEAQPAEFISDGTSLEGWRQPLGEWLVADAVKLDSANPEKFSITPGKGVLVNGANGRTVELITKAEFGDVEVHVEFCIAKKSNS